MSVLCYMVTPAAREFEKVSIFSLFSKKSAKEKEVGNDCWVNQLIIFITELKNLRDVEDKIKTVTMPHVN